jgi:DNA polymerase-3 subunit beta
MKFIVSKHELEEAVKNLSRVINSKNALPILGDILFEVNADEKSVLLTASDSEIWLQYTLTIDDCDGSGRFAVGNKRLADMLKGIPEQPVTIEVNADESRFAINYDCGYAYFSTDNADEYPVPLADPKNFKQAVIESDDLRTAIDRCLFAAANDDLRPIMNGICLDFEGNSFNAVASNGHVIMLSTHDANIGEAMECLIPRKVCAVMAKALKPDTDTYLLAEDRLCSIEQENMVLKFRFIEGKYVAYKKVIPGTQAHCVVVERKALMDALRAVIPFANDASNMVVLDFDCDNKLVVAGRDYDLSLGASRDLPAENYNGTEPMSIGLKGGTLLNVLGKISGSKVSINFDTADRAVVIKPHAADGNDEAKMLGLMMPMLLND